VARAASGRVPVRAVGIADGLREHLRHVQDRRYVFPNGEERFLVDHPSRPSSSTGNARWPAGACAKRPKLKRDC
jgi:hypothetical protein